MPVNIQPVETHVDNVDENVKPWEQPGTLSATHAAFGYHSDVSTTYPKGPYQSAEFPQEIPAEKENIFHPVKAVDDILAAVNGMTEKLDLVLKQMLLERSFTDEPAGLGATVAYTVDYKDRKFLYALTFASNVTLQTPQGTLPLSAGKWANVSFPRGTPIWIQGGSDSALTLITFRHCDVVMN
jgi:hypothetical protein